MAKSIKLTNDTYWDSSNIIHNNETLDTILEDISQNFDNIKIDTIFSRNKGVFNAQRVKFDASKYNLFLVEYNLYSSIDCFSTILITTYRSYYELSTPFFFSNKYYIGKRDFILDSGGIYFYDATNDIFGIDNAWYNPVKIIGIKLK